MSFQKKISDIVLGIRRGSKFIFSASKWPNCSLRVTNDLIGLFHKTKHENPGEAGHVIFKPVNEGEYFILSVAKWPAYTLYVCRDVTGGLKSYNGADPGNQGHMILTPRNDGEYFILTSRRWPEVCLYVCGDLMGGLISRGNYRENRLGGEAHIMMRKI